MSCLLPHIFLLFLLLVFQSPELDSVLQSLVFAFLFVLFLAFTDGAQCEAFVSNMIRIIVSPPIDCNCL